MFRRVIVECQQFVSIFGQARHRLGVLGLESLHRAIKGLVRLGTGLRHPDLLQISLDLGLHRFGQLIEHIRRLMHPATLMVGLRLGTGG